MGEYVRKVGAPAIDAAFADTWTALLAYALRRDQNVFPFSLWNRLGGATPQRVRWRAGRAFISPEYPRRSRGGVESPAQ